MSEIIKHGTNKEIKRLLMKQLELLQKQSEKDDMFSDKATYAMCELCRIIMTI